MMGFLVKKAKAILGDAEEEGPSWYQVCNW